MGSRPDTSEQVAARRGTTSILPLGFQGLSFSPRRSLMNTREYSPKLKGGYGKHPQIAPSGPAVFVTSYPSRPSCHLMVAVFISKRIADIRA